jgi:hypothetical protein
VLWQYVAENFQVALDATHSTSDREEQRALACRAMAVYRQQLSSAEVDIDPCVHLSATVVDAAQSAGVDRVIGLW